MFVVVHGKPFQSSLMFAGKHLPDAPHEGMLLALLTNITLGWKGLPGTNTNHGHKTFYDIKTRRG
jgi:hypothetical protein